MKTFTIPHPSSPFIPKTFPLKDLVQESQFTQSRNLIKINLDQFAHHIIGTFESLNSNKFIKLKLTYIINL